MWNQFMRTLGRGLANPKPPDIGLASEEVPDLLADNDNLREITYVRDALRYLRTEAKTLRLVQNPLHFAKADGTYFKGFKSVHSPRTGFKGCNRDLPHSAIPPGRISWLSGIH